MENINPKCYEKKRKENLPTSQTSKGNEIKNKNLSL